MAALRTQKARMVYCHTVPASAGRTYSGGKAPMKQLLSATAGLCVFCAASVNAAVVVNTADDGEGSLRRAVRSTGKNQVLEFAPQLAKQTITLKTPISIERDLTIDGAGAPGVTISGGKCCSAFVVGARGPVTAVIRNLTFVECKPADGGGGGAIDSRSQSHLTVERCTFKDNAAPKGGAAICCRWKHNTTVLESTFENNTSEANGGAISTESMGTLTVKKCVFHGNKGVLGGAIYSLLGALLLEDCVLTDNESSDAGGAVNTDGASDKTDDDIGGTITVRRCRVENSKGGSQGGAMFLFAYKLDKIVVEDSVFLNNRSAEGGLGGAIRFGGIAEVTAANSIFGGNAAGQGSGVYIGDDCFGKVEKCTFFQNMAGKTKGKHSAIQNNAKGPLVSEGHTFLNEPPPNLAQMIAALLQTTANAPAAKAGDAAPPAAPVKLFASKVEKPAADLAALMKDDPAIPAKDAALATLKEFLKRSAASGGKPSLSVKLDFKNYSECRPVSIDDSGFKVEVQGIQMPFTWRMLKDEELFNCFRPAMEKAPGDVFAAWLFLGLHGRCLDAESARNWLAKLQEKDPQQAQRVERVLQRLGK